MLLVLILPKFYDEEYEAMSRKLLEHIHRLEQEQEPLSPCGRGKILLRRRRSKLRRQVYIWTLRFLQLPCEQPSCWLASVLFTLSLITLPWFRAEFIPSAPPNDRYGTFYLWGLKFANEWIPIADTWMFAAEQIWLNVVVFVILFAWRSVDNLNCNNAIHQQEEASISEASLHHHQLQPLQQRKSQQRQLHEYPWFKGLEVLYWLWRVSELMALAAFYGGASALLYNILVVWISFVGYNLAWGKGGMFNQKRRSSPFPKLECPCNEEDDNRNVTHPINNTAIAKEAREQYDHGDHVYPLSLAITKAPDDMMTVHGSSTSNPNSSSGGESSSSASSTPINGSPRFWAKNRKRSLRRD